MENTTYMHENNIVAMDCSCTVLAQRFRNYMNTAISVLDWYSLYAPEWSDGKHVEYLNLCKAAHSLGF